MAQVNDDYGGRVLCIVRKATTAGGLVMSVDYVVPPCRIVKPNHLMMAIL